MDKSIYEQWLELVSGLEITVEDTYALLNPSDKDKFFETVNKAITNVFKLDQDGHLDTRSRKTFKVLAARYLIEFEKENKTSSTPMTYPINVPYTPYPSIPSVPETPRQLPLTWYQTQQGGPYVAQGPGPQIFYATTNRVTT